MEELKPVPRRESARPTVDNEAQWIDCSERMPGDGVYVLVVCEGVVQFDTARITSAMGDAEPYEPTGIKVWEWRQDWADDAPLSAITHWMPLPAPPTAARKGE